MAEKMITPRMRAENFATLTRKSWNTAASVAGAPNSRVTLQVPNVNLLASTRLMIEATLTVSHASATSYTLPAFAPYTMIEKLSFTLNTGFSPFELSGKEIAMWHLARDNSQIINTKNTGRARTLQGNVASSGAGTANKVRFFVDLSVVLNERDPYGLIMMQNPTTIANINITFGDGSQMISGSGYTATLSNVVVTPMNETFTIPKPDDAKPDQSIMKLVQASTYQALGAQDMTIRLLTGNTYRRILFYIEDASGNGVDDSFVTSEFNVIINTADTQYNIHPLQLAAFNQEWYGQELPKGMWALDFTYQGQTGYGGGRDLIDTERLTEFWLRFKVSAACTIRVVGEVISVLK